MNSAEMLREGERILKASPAIDHRQRGRGRIEAEELLELVFGDVPQADEDVAGSVRRTFMRLIERRAAGEPLPYIKGYADFLGLELLARPGVFVPRDSSEFLVIQAIRRLTGRRSPVLVDLATGGGTIALAVKDRVPAADVFGTDVASDAVRLARTNARRLGLEATFVRGDLFGGLPRRIAGRVDLVTLHPPYVPVDEMSELPAEIRVWEPERALTDGTPDGMGLTQRAVAEGPAWLVKGGWLLVEADPDAARRVKNVMVRGGLRDVEITKGGELKVTRVVTGRRPR